MRDVRQTKPDGRARSPVREGGEVHACWRRYERAGAIPVYGEYVRARCPASCANLGPGFDVLALAVNLYVEVEVTRAERLSVSATGEGSDLPADSSHLAAKVAMEVAGDEKLAIRVHSDIPVGRGLGSSAALALATAAAAGSRDPLGVAASVDGHPENAAASMLGGLVAATRVKGMVRAVPLALDPALRFVAVVPDHQLATAKARQALPSEVSLSNASFNLGRMGLLVAGLADATMLLQEATEDRLHQDFRSPVFPVAPQLLAELLRSGALASCWSGAGSTMLGICRAGDADGVRSHSEAAMAAMGIPGKVLLLDADRSGLVVDEGNAGAGGSSLGAKERSGRQLFDIVGE